MLQRSTNDANPTCERVNCFPKTARITMPNFSETYRYKSHQCHIEREIVIRGLPQEADIVQSSQMLERKKTSHVSLPEKFQTSFSNRKKEAKWQILPKNLQLPVLCRSFNPG